MKDVKTTMFLALGLIVAALLIACGDRTSGDLDKPSDSDQLVPDSELFGATVGMYDKDVLTAEIEFDKMVKFESLDSAMAYNLIVNVLDSIGQTTTYLVGDSGVIRETTGLMDVFGNVVLITEDSTRLETDYLHWNSRKQTISTDAFVRITKQDDLVTGWGLEADEALTRIKILNQVSGTLTDSKKATQ